ncbi:MAG TPA: M15 family metallopeptidase [Acidimicrobiia bacterium]|nr:M15 family metallopeptidase [Acidimicrobiia bacterium]
MPLDEDGDPLPVPTPPELSDRRFATVDLLPPPDDGGFHSTISEVPSEVAARSTWREGCPVALDELSYVTVSFVGFDQKPHTGELLVNAGVAEDIVGVFHTLFENGFPIEMVNITRPEDLEAEPTGDGNPTTAFVCRAATGGTGWSEHAYGLAIDINPFHNPYLRGETVLPELAGDYLDRSRRLPGMITEGDVVTQAFDEIGWGWGGRWATLKDWQHFSLRGR